jgi:hypothetical protein
MVRRVIIEFSLVEESVEKTTEEIEDEISAHLREGETSIPWVKQVEKVTVKSA